MRCIIGVLLLVAFASCDDNPFGNFNLSISASDIENAVVKTCEENGGKNAFADLKNSVLDLVKYGESNFNLEQIQNEIEESSKAGALDEVFKKYCDLRSKSLGYIHKIGDSVAACLTEDERPVFKLVVNITSSLLNFVCDKDGERIALFIAEGGFECFKSEMEELQKCSDVISDKIPTDLHKIPKLEVTKKECNEYKTFQGCVVEKLGKCKNSTPSDIIDALLTYIYKLSTCPTIA